MKQIGPWKILCNFSVNFYELELPTCIGISPIFNVCVLYPYQASDKDSFATNANNDEINEK